MSASLHKKDKVKIGVLILLWLAAFSPLYPELMRDWIGNSDNSHAILVPFISIFFAWQNRKKLADASIGTSAFGGVIFAASLLLYVASYAGGVVFPARVAMVTSLFGLVWFCLGGAVIRILAFPLGFLIFMVPVPYSLISLVSVPLQLLATRISEKLIAFCSIPVYREGNMLYFMQAQLEVAEACSGIRSIMSLTMLSVLFCYLSRDGWWRKTVLVLIAVPIAMVGNILRVTGTGILANFYGDKVARGFLHEFSGLVIFALGFAVLYAVFAIINREKHNVS